MLVIYSICTIAIAARLGWNMYRNLDQYDWHYHQSDIWLDFWLTLIFWPLIAVLRPSMLYRPTFKCNRPWGDAAECARQRISFMDSPPPCGSTITYRTFTDDDKELNAIFYFSAANVQVIAEHMSKEHTSLEGMYGAARWTSLRDESVIKPTEVPDLLMNFDTIIEDLIEMNHGQVFCHRCNKVYSASELSRETSGIGGAYTGWIFASFICSARHSLLTRDVMHIMRKRPED